MTIRLKFTFRSITQIISIYYTLQLTVFTMSQDREPHLNLNQTHDEAVYQNTLIPNTIYRLRLSILKDSHGDLSCPSQMFVSLSLLVGNDQC